MTLNPTDNLVPEDYPQQLVDLLHNPRTDLVELNSQEKDIPHSNNAGSGYLLLYLTLLFAKDVTLNGLHSKTLITTSHAYNNMYDIKNTQPTYGQLTRRWIEDINILNQDPIACLPQKLREIYNEIQATLQDNEHHDTTMEEDSPSTPQSSSPMLTD